MMLFSLPAAKEPTVRHVLNKTAMVLYLSTDTITKSRVTYALASDVANCMMITRPHMVDPTGMVRTKLLLLQKWSTRVSLLA
jgi:hypothetical protein